MEKTRVTQDDLVEIIPTIAKDSVSMGGLSETEKKTYEDLYDFVGDMKIVADDTLLRDVGLDPANLNGKLAFCTLSLFKKKNEDINIASWFTVSNRNPHITTHILYGYQYLEQRTLLGGD